jgi:predicted MPP superfamily phosphohydrolase
MIYTFIFLVASLSVFLAIFLGNRLPAWLTLIFEQAGGYFMILFIFMLAGALLGDLLRVANHYFSIFPEWVVTQYSMAKLLYFGIVLAALTALSLIGFVRFSNPSLVNLNLEAGKNSGQSGDLVLIAASDIHLGNVVRKGRLVKWVELINEQKPDLILLVGDIIDHSYQAVVNQEMDKELLKLKATYGVYAVPGNHDYYAGIDQALDFLKRSGIQVLRDTAITVSNRLVLIGRDDLTNKNRKPLHAILNGMQSDLPKIVLDHQPLSIKESIDNQIDFHLSGHTHDGQIFPFNKFVSLIYEQGYGYRRSGNTHSYVSSGLGLWGAPIRLGTRSEIVKINLRDAENN